jgi:hypothetical protein
VRIVRQLRGRALEQLTMADHLCIAPYNRDSRAGERGPGMNPQCRFRSWRSSSGNQIAGIRDYGFAGNLLGRGSGPWSVGSTGKWRALRAGESDGIEKFPDAGSLKCGSAKMGELSLTCPTFDSAAFVAK